MCLSVIWRYSKAPVSFRFHDASLGLNTVALAQGSQVRMPWKRGGRVGCRMSTRPMDQLVGFMVSFHQLLSVVTALSLLRERRPSVGQVECDVRLTSLWLCCRRQAVCVFVNDVCNAPVLEELSNMVSSEQCW